MAAARQERGSDRRTPSPTTPRERSRVVRRVLFVVLLLNVALVAAKIGAWWSSRALSVLAEATQSSVDALNNVLALTVVRIAGRAPDADHPYGHRKFETLGVLAVVAILSITVFELVQEAVLRLLAEDPPVVEGTPVAIGILLVSAAIGTLVSVYESRRGRALGSDLLLADAAHARSDVLAALAVVAGLLAVRAGHPQVDAWIALGVAMVIAHTGWRIIREAVPDLVDERAVEARTIREVATATRGVRDCYRVRSRGKRGDVFAELTISVDPGLDVQASHAISDDVERRVTEHLSAREVVVHVEPAD